jgi:hypothetical protein
MTPGRQEREVKGYYWEAVCGAGMAGRGKTLLLMLP